MRSLAAAVLFGGVSWLVACAPPGERVEPVAEAAPAQPPLVGAWSVTDYSAVDADGTEANVAGPQPSLYLFLEGYYSIMFVSEDGSLTPRSEARQLYADEAWPPETPPTDADKVAAYDSFIANSGSYEVSESSLTMDPIVAKDPNFMANGSVTFGYEVDGDTLVLAGSDDQGGTSRITLQRLE